MQGWCGGAGGGQWWPPHQCGVSLCPALVTWPGPVWRLRVTPSPVSPAAPPPRLSRRHEHHQWGHTTDHVTPTTANNTEQSFPRNSNYSNSNIVGLQVVSTKISRHGASTADQFWYSEAASGRNIWSWVFAFRSPSNLLLELSVENLKKVVLNPRHVEILWIRPLVNWIISIHQI